MFTEKKYVQDMFNITQTLPGVYQVVLWKNLHHNFLFLLDSYGVETQMKTKNFEKTCSERVNQNIHAPEIYTITSVYVL